MIFKEQFLFKFYFYLFIYFLQFNPRDPKKSFLLNMANILLSFYVIRTFHLGSSYCQWGEKNSFVLVFLNGPYGPFAKLSCSSVM